MPKNIAVGKRLKIDKAQQNMLMAVAGAAFVLGVSLVFAVYLLKYIRFNTAVIGAKDTAIQGYSNTIRDIGICSSPSGKTYNKSELEMCNPNEVDLNTVTDSLRYDVIMNLSQNAALESVARTGLPICYDTSTNERYSFDKIYERYRYASNPTDRENYLNMIGLCSSLRVIPDALPSSENPLALGSSLNKLFQMSDYIPEGISPGEPSDSDLSVPAIGLSLELETDTTTALRVLNNLEKSIRTFNVRSATIETSGNTIHLSASALAYYTNPASLTESQMTVTGKGKVMTVTSEDDMLDEEVIE